LHGYKIYISYISGDVRTTFIDDPSQNEIDSTFQQTTPQNKKLSKPRLPYADLFDSTDDIFKELIVKPSAYLAKLPNATSAAVLKSQKLLYEDFLRGKRGTIDLAGIIKCATNCNPLSFKGYGCYCGFLGSGEPVDGIDTQVIFNFSIIMFSHDKLSFG
jgi:hypothetical protein